MPLIFNPDGTISYGSPRSNDFDRAFDASRDPRLTMARRITDYFQRVNVMLELAQLGLPVFEEIDFYGADPYDAMDRLYKRGFRWRPGFGQPAVRWGPGIQPYSGHETEAYDPMRPPAGSLKVVEPETCDLAV